jgi:hypothetical protein
MARRRFVWVLSVPLAAVGWIAGHWLAYRLVAQDGVHHERLLDATGHGYLSVAPLIVACAITVLLVGVSLAIVDGARGRAPSRPVAWPVALVPPLGFAVQEHLERAIEWNTFPLDAALEPTFVVGMALQLPIAALACLAARAMLVFGRAVGRRVAAPPVLRPRARNLDVQLSPRRPAASRGSILAGGHGQRAPPGAMTA